MTAPKRRVRRWSDAESRGASAEPKMPTLVDGKITASQLVQAFTVLQSDGPDEAMTFDDVVNWLDLHVRRPHPPSSSTPPGTRGVRRPQRYATPAGRPGRLHKLESSAA